MLQINQLDRLMPFKTGYLFVFCTADQMRFFCSYINKRCIMGNIKKNVYDIHDMKKI